MPFSPSFSPSLPARRRTHTHQTASAADHPPLLATGPHRLRPPAAACFCFRREIERDRAAAHKDPFQRVSVLGCSSRSKACRKRQQQALLRDELGSSVPGNM